MEGWVAVNDVGQQPSLASKRVISSSAELQTKLSGFVQMRMRPRLPTADFRTEVAEVAELSVLEQTFLEAERGLVESAAALAPTDPQDFVAWFERLEESGAGQGDALFDFLATRASREALRYFLKQEVAGEAGFDDLVALTQVQLPLPAKLELARNYWDEMGRGQEKGMHGPMLAELAAEARLDALDVPILWEARALANLLAGLALNRRYAFQAVGALGVVELTAPGRAVKVNTGLRRVGFSPRGCIYFALHSTLDVKHSASWNREVLRTSVAERPELAQAIAEGALMRLNAGARCFSAYRRELGLSDLRFVGREAAAA